MIKDDMETLYPRLKAADIWVFGTPVYFDGVSGTMKNLMEIPMRRLNPAYVEVVAREVSRCPYFALLSMDIKDIGWGECLIEVVIEEKHLQPFGMVHGGVYSSLVDATAFWAVYSQIDEDLGMTTVELKLNFLAPAVTGRMIGKGRSLRVGKTLCLGEASVVNEAGTLLAHGTSTMMILKDLKIHSGAGLPRKFID